MSFSLLTRRGFLRLAGTFVAGASASVVYGPFILPFYCPPVTRPKLAFPRLTPDLRLRVAVIADLHACDPWMNAERIASIVAMTNDLQPDVVLLLGDYTVSYTHLDVYKRQGQDHRYRESDQQRHQQEFRSGRVDLRIH